MCKKDGVIGEKEMEQIGKEMLQERLKGVPESEWPRVFDEFVKDFLDQNIVVGKDEEEK